MSIFVTCLNFAGTGSRLYVAFVMTWYLGFTTSGRTAKAVRPVISGKFQLVRQIKLRIQALINILIQCIYWAVHSNPKAAQRLVHKLVPIVTQSRTGLQVGPIVHVPLTVRYSPSSEVQTRSFTWAARNEPNLSSIFLLSENVENYWSDTTMDSVAYRTSLDRFCDVKPNLSQLLKAHVYDGRPFWFSFF